MKPKRSNDKYWKGTRDFDHIQYESDLEDYISDIEGNGANKISSNLPVSGMLSLAEIETFIWEIGEDYHLWDEKEQGQYPAKRVLTAIQKWWTALSKR